MVLEGKVTEAKYTYQRLTFIKPTEHHYEKKGEVPYIKYGCPVCDALGNKHQLTFGEKNCGLCNVNLTWDELWKGEKENE
ncbi:hypothetical protein AAXB25_14940 [Paenibacillus lautus]|uniref:hypothetical protein n=1 Tax=Paenibacillus lautus TaxID=1401 RepID=UPI003D2828BF